MKLYGHKIHTFYLKCCNINPKYTAKCQESIVIPLLATKNKHGI